MATANGGFSDRPRCAHAVAALALACALAACSRGPDSAHVTAEELARAPLPASFEGLDPDAEALIRAEARDVDEDATRPEAWTRLGMVLQAHGELSLARTCYDQRLVRDPEDARTWYYRALANEDLGAVAAANLDLLECERRDASYAPARWRRGLLALAERRFDDAETAFEAALALAPGDAAATVGLARLRLQERRAAEAIALLEEHLRALPTDANARWLLGTAYRDAGRLADAERMLAGGASAEPIEIDPWQSELLTLQQGARVDFLRALELLGRGDVDAAEPLLEALRRETPDDPLVLVALHRAYRLRGDVDAAIELLLAAQRLAPRHEMVHLHLAGAYRDKANAGDGAPDRALLGLALESARAAADASPTYAEAHGMCGDVLLDLGQRAQATDAWLQAADLDRRSVRWQKKAAQALCLSGRWDEALPVLERLDTLEPDTPGTLYLLGAAHANMGRLDEAAAALERARVLAPDDAEVARAWAALAQERAAGPPADESDG